MRGRQRYFSYRGNWTAGNSRNFPEAVKELPLDPFYRQRRCAVQLSKRIVFDRVRRRGSWRDVEADPASRHLPVLRQGGQQIQPCGWPESRAVRRTLAAGPQGETPGKLVHTTDGRRSLSFFVSTGAVVHPFSCPDAPGFHPHFLYTPLSNFLVQSSMVLFPFE